MLKTIKLPRNLRQLNKILPKKNYDEPIETVDKDTMRSEAVPVEKLSQIKYREKLNYESDANNIKA